MPRRAPGRSAQPASSREAELEALLADRDRRVAELERQQAAAGEILRAISRAAGDTSPVLERIAEAAGRLCGGLSGGVYLGTPSALRLAAQWVATADQEATERVGGRYPAATVGHETPLDEPTIHNRAFHAARTEYVPDLERVTPDELPHPAARARGIRTFAAVPLRRGDAALGVLSVFAGSPDALTDRHLRLLESFADQAVIAIENARLFAELQDSNADLSEALDQQTATAQVLQIISRSAFDLQRVLDTLVDNAARLTSAETGVMFRVEGDHFELAANYGASDDFIEVVRSRPVQVDRGTLSGRAALERKPVRVADVLADQEYRRLDAQQTESYRSAISVPLLRQDDLVGVITLWKSRVEPFSDRQLDMIRTFADQAVIAIENARLFSELQSRTEELGRSVEQLTALAEVSQIVSSTLDLQKVLDTIVARATELTASDGAAVYEYDVVSQRLELRATRTFDESLVAELRANPLRIGEGASGRAAATRQPVMIPDIAVAGAYESSVRDTMLRSGYRAALAIPLLREDEVVGSLVLTRRAPGDYPADVVDLVSTFATQSALAIQNARLFAELADKSAQLEEASRHKSEFLANMSHELRTPLNAVIGFTEVLLERYFGEINDKQEEYLRDVLSSGQHLLSLINDILDLSKVEAGRMELELSTFDLGPVLEAGLVMVRERTTRGGVALSLAVADDLGQVEADERKVKQVLFNLLTNAVKFTPAGGKVVVSARRTDEHVEVAVADTGVGIAPEEQARVFEEFGQARSASGQSEGTGLGLTLCKRFVELHGGTIRVTSAVGTGSTFTCTLPVRQPARAAVLPSEV